MNQPGISNTLNGRKRMEWPVAKLQEALMPVHTKIFHTQPESFPFLLPVNPEFLGIPDYFTIVKKPMDLSTIKSKLSNGRYLDPWGFCDDMRLMFDNAWLYNKKTTKVYKYCTKLSEIFEAEIDPVMKSLGFCCGKKYLYNAQVLYCYGKNFCAFSTDTPYYSFQNSYHFCERCFNEFRGETIDLGEDSGLSKSVVRKADFKRLKNEHLEPEPFVECTVCGRKHHQICVLHLDAIWETGFVCDSCREDASLGRRKDNLFTARNLPQSRLGSHIEKRVNQYIMSQDAPDAGYVTIRVVSSVDRQVVVKPGMRMRYPGEEFVDAFPYRARAVFAFEEVDGVEVCFSGMHTQEFFSDCPAPNANRINISCLDSVNFFRPRRLRTKVYYEILIAYFEFCKILGFRWVHVWSCPPSPGYDCIFHCHPCDQKIPDLKRLVEWYRKMLDKAIECGVVVEHKDILSQTIDDNATHANQLPYFEGDFWPTFIECAIRAIQKEEEKRGQQASSQEAVVAATASADDPDKNSNDDLKGLSSSSPQPCTTAKIVNKSRSRNTLNCELSKLLFAAMDKLNEAFFVIRLHKPGEEPAKIEDPDPLQLCKFVEDRETFLKRSQEKHWEFSTLRRAKFSSMSMLVELHEQAFDYICNSCRARLFTRYRCTVCKGFDLCYFCYNKNGHEHRMDRMEKFSIGIESGSPTCRIATAPRSQEARLQSMWECVASLEHASSCDDQACGVEKCAKIKKAIRHARIRREGPNRGCFICKQFIALCCFHGKSCKKPLCYVPYCGNVKRNVQEHLQRRRLQQRQVILARIATTIQPRQNAQHDLPASSEAMQHPSL